MRIYLIGLSGAGKTHWGQWLAQRWQWPFYDLDTLFEQQEQYDIAAFFGQFGEQTFRQKEQEILHQTAHLQNAVIATGGGTPVFSNNMAWMNAQGLTVFIHQTPAQILTRLNPEDLNKRPLLAQPNVLHSLETLYTQRLPIYQQAQFEARKPEQFNWDQLRVS